MANTCSELTLKKCSCEVNSTIGTYFYFKNVRYYSLYNPSHGKVDYYLNLSTKHTICKNNKSYKFVWEYDDNIDFEDEVECDITFNLENHLGQPEPFTIKGFISTNFSAIVILLSNERYNVYFSFND